jgi:3-deoxy-D-manno-octulosonic-acid transferase
VARDVEVATVVDADLGNDEGGLVGADLAVCDLHGTDLRNACGGDKDLRPQSEKGSVRPMSPLAVKGPPGLRYRLFLWAYTGILWLAQPAIWRYFRQRAGRDPDYALHLDERQGEGAPFPADLWVHAVSMGEMRSAVPLVRLALEDGFRVVTTHATPAGRREAERAFGAEVDAGRLAIRYAPVDLPDFWRRFFERHSPGAGVVMEMEFWPRMIEAAREAGVPLVLANSQVPARSFPRAARLARLFGHPVSRVAAVFAKSEQMAARFRVLGAAPVVAMGETRFDIPLPEAQVVAGKALARTRAILTLASVVAGEEDTYVTVLKELFAEPSPPLAIWVPRAPELFGPTADRLRAAGFRVALRTEAFDADLAPTQDLGDAQILLGNSMGEMFFYLAPADAVIVGGGFTQKGAHNVIEPLSLGKPVLTGPETWTIEFPAVEAEAAGVLTVVPDAAALPGAVRQAMASGGKAAEAFHAANRGASARILDAIRPALEGRA